MSASIDTDLANVQAQIKQIRQKRKLMQLHFDQESFATETRYHKTVSKLNNLRSHPHFHLYFEAMDEPNQAPYVTKKEALLCRTFLQINSNTHQERLANKHAIKMIRMLKECIKKQQDEKRCMEESLQNQCAVLRKEIIMRQKDIDEAKLQKERAEMAEMDDNDTSITARGIQNDSNGSFGHSSVDFQSVLDGLSHALFGISATELQDSKTQDSEEHPTTDEFASLEDLSGTRKNNAMKSRGRRSLVQEMSTRDAREKTTGSIQRTR